MESYGLIGLFAVMQAWLTLLDMGMTPTLNREMARFTAGAHSAQSIQNLLRSLEVIAICIAAVIILLIWASSGYLASDWLKAGKLLLRWSLRQFLSWVCRRTAVCGKHLSRFSLWAAETGLVQRG